VCWSAWVGQHQHACLVGMRIRLHPCLAALRAWGQPSSRLLTGRVQASHPNAVTCSWVVRVLVSLGQSAPACEWAGGGYEHLFASVPGSFEGLEGAIKQTYDM
jgi:hypothetical protein